MMSRDRQALPGSLAAVDIGTAKIVCLVVAPGEDGGATLLGIGHQRSRGMKSGVVTDGDEAASALKAVMGQAERMAGASAERVVLSVACGRLQSTRFIARVPVDGGVVHGEHCDRVLTGAQAWLERGGRTVVEVVHSDWRLDGQDGIRRPHGMAGRELAVELSAITADEGPLRNLIAVAERSHVAVDGLLAAPAASALAVTTAEERRIGVLVVDIGGGVTTLAQIVDGRPVVIETLPVGGNHITYDLARGLATTVAEAERIKTLYGTLVKAASNDMELVSYPVVGEEEPSLFQVSRARIGELIRPRVDHLLELVAERLAGRGVMAGCTGPVVLTGGSSQLVGLDAVWCERFGGLARIGRTRPLGRMPGSMCSPAFATAIGLVLAAERMSFRGSEAAIGSGYIGRVQQWFRDSFQGF